MGLLSSVGRTMSGWVGGDHAGRAGGFTDEQVRLARAAEKRSQQQWDVYRSEYLPMVQQLKADAAELGSESGQRRYADEYSGEYTQQANKARQMTARNMGQYGVPGSGRFGGTQRALQVMQAAGGANAANRGRAAARTGARQITTGMLPGGSAMSGQSSATLASAMQGLGSAADREASADASQRGDFFGLLADGGMVDIPDGDGNHLSRPINDRMPQDGGVIRGPGTGTSDSIGTEVQDGEYYFPRYAVKYYGHDKLDKMLVKARDAQGAGQIPNPPQGEAPVGAPMALAHGGPVEGGGSIKARVSNGEFYWPQYAVDFYGTDKLDKMISKAQEARDDPEGPRAEIYEMEPEGDRPGYAGGLMGYVLAGGGGNDSDSEPIDTDMEQPEGLPFSGVTNERTGYAGGLHGKVNRPGYAGGLMGRPGYAEGLQGEPIDQGLWDDIVKAVRGATSLDPYKGKGKRKNKAREDFKDRPGFAGGLTGLVTGQLLGQGVDYIYDHLKNPEELKGFMSEDDTAEDEDFKDRPGYFLGLTGDPNEEYLRSRGYGDAPESPPARSPRAIGPSSRASAPAPDRGTGTLLGIAPRHGSGGRPTLLDIAPRKGSIRAYFDDDGAPVARVQPRRNPSYRITDKPESPLYGSMAMQSPEFRREHNPPAETMAPDAGYGNVPLEGIPDGQPAYTQADAQRWAAYSELMGI